MSGRNPPEKDYEIGYRRPPVGSQFQAGQSGNPKGRPKGQKTVGDHLRAALMAKVRVVENGRTRIYTAQEVIIRNLVAEAARKNMRAIQTVFALQARYGSSAETVMDPAELSPDDRDIVQAFIDQVKASAAPGDPPPSATHGAAQDAEGVPDNDGIAESKEGGRDD